MDEWQRYPPSWDVVRRAVDDDNSPGRFMLTGSATPTGKPTHSGAGRIVPLRMRPLTLVERGVETPTVSLAALLTGNKDPLAGTTAVTAEDYATEILAGGFPGMRHSSGRAQRAAIDGYLERMVDTDLPELGVEVRNPATLQRWVRAYAAATSTTTSYDKIRDAATSGEDTKPAKSTTIPYRDALERIWILEPVPAWTGSANHLRRLTSAPKHQLADPALAARLVGVDAQALLRGEGPGLVRRRSEEHTSELQSLMCPDTTSFRLSTDKIPDASPRGEDTKPAKSTTIPYRDALERIWILGPLPAWTGSANHLRRLTSAPKHQLADPALAARLVGVDAQALLRGEGPGLVRRDGNFLGALFESLATLDVRVFAQTSEATE